MIQIIETIPNFSVCKELNPDIFEKLVIAAGNNLISTQTDKDHNRSVFTLIGHPNIIETTMFNLAKCAIENIDLTKHKGEHPRMGAVDVIPFVPIKNSSMEECIAISKRIGKRIGEILHVPVFLYEYSTKERKNLADIRRGEFEGMLKHMNKPDFGPSTPHPTAGAVTLGARKFLIAYNVNLDTQDIQIAKNIASKIREKNGGYKGIKALGMNIGCAQVSMNICDFEATGVKEIFDAIKDLSPVPIKNSELIGMAPAATRIEENAEHLMLKDFDPQKQIIDYQI